MTKKVAPEPGSEKKRPGQLVDTGGAGSCMVGEAPALGYTVGQLIDRLSQYPRDIPVGMNVGLGSNLELLSLYLTAEQPEVVWFDLGEAT